MQQNLNGRVLIFSGRANVELSEDICKYMGIKLGRTVIKDFSDEEIYVRIEENVRGGDVFIIQPTCYPTGANPSWLDWAVLGPDLAAERS